MTESGFQHEDGEAFNGQDFVKTIMQLLEEISKRKDGEYAYLSTS